MEKRGMVITGYINPNNYFPSALIIIAKEGNIFYCFFPNGEKYQVEDYEMFARKSDKYLPATNNVIYEEKMYAFAVDRKTIYIDSLINVNRKLQDLLNSLDIDLEKKNIIKKYLQNEDIEIRKSLQLNNLTWDGYFNKLKNLNAIKFLIHKRFIGKRNEYADRIIIQVKNQNRWKTYYSKNFYVGETYSNKDIKVKGLYSLVSPAF